MFSRDTARVEKMAMDAVMEIEDRLGHQPRDVSAAKVGYDIESRVPDGRGGWNLRFLEVKGRVVGAETVTVTRNEILTGLNAPTEFLLAVVFVNGDNTQVHYLDRPFTMEPDFGATSVNYNLRDIMPRAKKMSRENQVEKPCQ